MSPSPIDATTAPALAAPTRALVDPAGRARAAVARWLPASILARLTPPERLFLQADGVTSWPAGPDAPAIAPSAMAWLAPNRGRAVHVVLAGGFTRQILVRDPAAPLDDPATLVAWARHQFSGYYGSDALAWPCVTWVSHRQRVACALNGIDLDALRRSAAQHGVRLGSVEPWWSVALRALGRSEPERRAAPHFALALVEDTLLTWIRCEGGRIVDLAQRRLEANTSAALTALLAEIASPLPGDASICVGGYGLRDSGPWPDARWVVQARLDVASPPWPWVAA